MPKFTFKERRETGLQFIQFLKDSGRQSETDRAVLRTFYTEFKNRDNERRPSFSNVLYTLVQSGHAEVLMKNIVRFGTMKKKVKLANQYWRSGNTAGVQTSLDPALAAVPPLRRSRAKDRAEFISKKNGMDIVSDHDLVNGRIRFPVSIDEAKTVTIRVKNDGNLDVTLNNFRKLRKSHELTFKVSQRLPVRIPPGEILSSFKHSSGIPLPPLPVE